MLTIPGRGNQNGEWLSGGEGKISATLDGPGGTEKAVELEPVEEIFSNDDPVDLE